MKHPAIALVAVAILLLRFVPARAQTAPVEIKLAFSKGDVSYLASTVTIDGEVRLLNNTITLPTSTARSRDVIRVLDVEADGTFVIESAVENLEISVAGQTQQSFAQPTTLRVRPDGKVGGVTDVEVFPFAFPDRPVSVGDTWSHRLRTLLESGQQVDAQVTYTVAAIDSGSEGRVIRITTRMTGTASGGSMPVIQGVRVTPPKGTMRGGGEISWLVDRSRIIRRTEEVVAQVESDLTAEGQTVKIATTIRIREQAEILSAEAARPPVPPAERLIVAGASIGGIALDAAVADLNLRLGSPTEPATIPPLLASRIRWPNGLSGILDPSDANKLMGLSIADPQYSTDKGIGFGSSEGAVLFAYGTPSARVDVPLQVGSARMLVYKDAGIALAITADAAHAQAAGRHAPVGAVDWVEVFAPANAAKIYPP